MERLRDKITSFMVWTQRFYVEYDLLKIYEKLLKKNSDIREHLETLKLFASRCKTVTEFGVRSGRSTVAFLLGKPEKLTICDINRPLFDIPRYTQLVQGNTKFRFIRANVLTIEIEPTDLLFIDTYHIYDQLKKELELHANKVKKWIMFHDTVTFGVIGQDKKSRGLRFAIKEFLNENTNWKLLLDKHNNNGLTVIERKN